MTALPERCRPRELTAQVLAPGCFVNVVSFVLFRLSMMWAMLRTLGGAAERRASWGEESGCETDALPRLAVPVDMPRLVLGQLSNVSQGAIAP